MTEVTMWARLNATALRQRNATALRKQWEDGGHKMEHMQPNDIPKLIRKTGGFDTTNADSEFNLERMVMMQDEAAARDTHHEKTRQHQYRGILGLWRDEGEPEEFNELLPQIRQEPDCDSTFDNSFKIAYPLPNLGRVLMHVGHKVTREHLAWPQQIRD